MMGPQGGQMMGPQGGPMMNGPPQGGTQEQTPNIAKTIVNSINKTLGKK
jgi:hypothetical protein